MSAHTPGPWTAVTHGADPEVPAHVKWTRREADGRIHADFIADCHRSARNEQDANARLIATAPEMLELLADALSGARFCVGICGHEICGRVRGVVAKAKGAK